MAETGKAVAILVKIPAWKCSNCGRIMPLVKEDEPPKRCSNRKTCGAMFRAPEENKDA